MKVGYLQEIDQGYTGIIHQAFIDRWPTESSWSNTTNYVEFIPLEDNRTENFLTASDHKLREAERREHAGRAIWSPSSAVGSCGNSIQGNTTRRTRGDLLRSVGPHNMRTRRGEKVGEQT